METTNSLPKQQAVDGQGAFAGNAGSEQDTVDALMSQAGMDPVPGEATGMKRILDERDENRWELDPDSARSNRPMG